MTDRFHSLTVALEHDIRDDDAAPILAAIQQIKGVIAVSGNVSEPSDFVAKSRLLHDLAPKLMDLLTQEWRKS